VALSARKLYEDGLADLRLQVELMGAKVERNLDLMRQVLASGDETLAATALAADDDIDATNLSLTERCYELMVRQAPVAGDLRLLVSVVRVASDIERIGDLALRVVKLTPDHRYLAAQPVLFDTLLVMADRATDSYREALSTWAAADAAGAARLLAAGSPTAHLAQRRARRHALHHHGPGARPHRRPRPRHRRPGPLPGHRRSRPPRRRGPLTRPVHRRRPLEATSMSDFRPLAGPATEGRFG
jgi:phosphate transport system protein